MSDVNPPAGHMSMEQINRNFIAVNEELKAMRARYDEICGKYDRLATAFVRVEQENQTLRLNQNLLLAKHFTGAATTETG